MRPTLFAFLPDEHPLRPGIDRFEAELRRRIPRASLPGSRARTTAHAHLGAEPAARSPRITSLYWSMQYGDGAGFGARTLSCTHATGVMEWLAFPADPRLPGLAGFLDGNPDAEVLRYVPLRRATLRVPDPSGRAMVVAKVKRASRLHEAWAMLETVERRIDQARPSFRVPHSLALDERRGLYLQEAMPGRVLSALVDERSAPELLARLGGLHRELHALPIEGLPERAPADTMRDVRADAAWIAYLLPELRHPTAQLVEVIGRAVPETAPAFCHGDADCSQVVVDGDRWSLLDFDGCHAGDPYRDIAMLAASLDYHVPRFRDLAEDESDRAAGAVEQAAEAYLAGYFAGAPGDPTRLAWHRACAEMYYLALVLRKDRYHPRAFGRRWRRLESQAALLGRPA